LTFLTAIILGIVQGLTEFLPISSSAHLVFAQSLLNMTEPPLFFDVMLHFGTLLAVVVFFWRDIRDIVLSIFGSDPGVRRSNFRSKSSARMFFWYIIFGTIPTLIIALILKKTIEKAFMDPFLVAIMLIITGVILWLSGRIGQRGKLLNTKSAIIIGIAQGIAALPGISRSGSTISTALMLGVDGEQAARFSLLMSIPAIFGASILELNEVQSVDIPLAMILVGIGVAFIVGLIAIGFLVRVLKRGHLSRFAYYCWAVGALAIVWHFIKG
jgi:undecaprenyl-diphosphatase